MSKKICILLFVIFLSLLPSALCFGAPGSPPKRIAVLPVLRQASALYQPQLENTLAELLKKELHVPLNNTLKAVVYLPPEEIQTAITELDYDNAALQNPANLKCLAEKLSADLIVCLLITDVKEIQYYAGWDQSIILHSTVQLQLLGWNHENDFMFSYKDRQSYHDEYSLRGTVPELSKGACWRLLKKANLKNFIFPLSKKA
ncbi:MAG: hypothetical protein ACRC7I_01775 [Selenomonadaceae bacterium]